MVAMTAKISICVSLLLRVIVVTSEDNGEGQSSSNRNEDELVELEELRNTLNDDENQIIMWTVEDGQTIPGDHSHQTHYSEFDSDKTYIILQGNYKAAGQYWVIYCWIEEKSFDIGKTVCLMSLQNIESAETSTGDFASYKSGKNYIVTEGKSKVKPEHWNIYYWIGKYSSEPIAVEAASYAVLLDAIIHPTVNIRREPEGHESNSFKAIFEHTVTSENLFEGLMAAHKDPSESKNGPKLLWIGGKDEIRLEEVKGPSAEFGSVSKLKATQQGSGIRPRMFLIKGNYEIKMKEVELSLRYTRETDNCLVFGSESVYVYIGNTSSEPQQKIALKLARRMMRKRNSDAKKVVIHRSDNDWSYLTAEENESLLQFALELERVSDAMRNQSIENEEKTKIANKALKLREEKNTFVRSGNALAEETISTLKTDECYLMDPHQDVGVFLWIGTKCEIDRREECARGAEGYMREKGFDHATPIIFTSEETISFPSEASLNDYIQFLLHERQSKMEIGTTVENNPQLK